MGRTNILLVILLSTLTNWCCNGVRVNTELATPPELHSIIYLESHGSVGMGVPISSHSVLTVMHIVTTFVDATGVDRTFRVTWRDPKRDLALLEIDSGLPFISWVSISGSEPKPAEPLFMLCYLNTNWDKGTLVGRYIGLDNDHDMLIDGFSINGMSGGAVLNAKGELVGIMKATWKPNEMSRSVADATPVFGERF